MKTRLFSVIPTYPDIITRVKEKQQGAANHNFLPLPKYFFQIVSFSENWDFYKIIDAYTIKVMLDLFKPNLLFGD